MTRENIVKWIVEKMWRVYIFLSKMTYKVFGVSYFKEEDYE